MIRDLYTKAMLAIIAAALLSLFSVYRFQVVQNGLSDHNGIMNLSGHPIVEVWKK
jgi:hypothetical protein